MILSKEKEAELIWEMLILDSGESYGFRHALYMIIENPRELSEALYKLDYRQKDFPTQEEFTKDYIENRYYWVYGADLDNEEYSQYLQEFHVGLEN